VSTYATIDEVRARLPYRTIDDDSVPTEEQVEAWLDEAEAQLLSRLTAIQLPTPAAPPAASGLIVRSWVSDYVRGLVLQAWSSSTDSDTTTGDKEVDIWRAMLDEIFSAPQKFGAILGAASPPDATRRIRSHILDNADNRSVDAGDFTPVITRRETF
jgi:hypothetical protein